MERPQSREEVKDAGLCRFQSAPAAVWPRLRPGVYTGGRLTPQGSPETFPLCFHRALQQGKGKRARQGGEEEVQGAGEGEEEAQSGERHPKGERRGQAARQRLVEARSRGGANVCGDAHQGQKGVEGGAEEEEALGGI